MASYYPEAELQARYEEIERDLLRLGRWGIVSGKVLGYMPQTITETRMEWKLKSWSLLYSALIIALGIAWVIIYKAYLPEIGTAFELTSSTERLAYTILTLLLESATLGFKIRNILSAKYMTDFWAQTVGMLTKLSLTKYLDFMRSERTAEFRELFEKLGRTIRWDVVVLWSLFGVQIMISVFGMGPNLYRNLGMIFWYSSVFLHPAFSIWIMFFPRIYTICLKMIQFQLRAVGTCNDEDEDVSSDLISLGRIKSPAWTITAPYPRADEDLLNTKDSVFRKISSGGAGGQGENNNKNEIFPFPSVLLPQFHQTNGIYISSNLFHETSDEKLNNREDQGYRLMDHHHRQKRNTEKVKLDPKAIEDMVSICVDSYYTVDEQLTLFNSVYGRHLMGTIVIVIVIMLDYTFFMFMWAHKGELYNICNYVPPLVIYSLELYLLTSAAERLQEEAENIFNTLNDLPFDLLSNEMLAKIRLLALKISSTPPKIEPCRFFTLNRSLITSILSALTMYLIVLVQFQNADKN